jgi:hypothetical protein
MNRRTDLLNKAAEALENGEDPLAVSFLSGHEVTSEECMSLAQQLAIGARLVAYGLEHPREPEGRAVLLSMTRNL